jgi:hypothetical protein
MALRVGKSCPGVLTTFGEQAVAMLQDSASRMHSTAAEWVGERLGLPDGSVLVQPSERQWAPQTRVTLPSSHGTPSESIGIVRNAFLPHDGKTRSLKEDVTLMGKSVGVAARALLENERLLVDEYEASGDGSSYVLKTVGTDLVRYIMSRGMHVEQVPGVGGLDGPVGGKQSSREVLMVAPTAFIFNDQAAQDNTFMNTKAGDGSVNVTGQVLNEFSNLYKVLTEDAGVKVNLFQHSLEHGTPDAVFPNNWFSTHSASEAYGGVEKSTLVYYPMKCPNRQAERREDIRSILESSGYERIIDLSGHEKNGKYFEGTGTLVIDRRRGTAFVALSERADKDVAEEWVERLGYKDLVTFHSVDANGKPVYHTNVMMAVGTSVAVACLESIVDDAERKNFVSSLSKTHEIVDITQEQMAALCGNVLELQDERGLPIMAMSTRAYNAFTKEQRDMMRRHVAALHHANIDTLEHIGGGGVRCTLAEIFH